MKKNFKEKLIVAFVIAPNAFDSFHNSYWRNWILPQIRTVSALANMKLALSQVQYIFAVIYETQYYINHSVHTGVVWGNAENQNISRRVCREIYQVPQQVYTPVYMYKYTLVVYLSGPSSCQ